MAAAASQKGEGASRAQVIVVMGVSGSGKTTVTTMTCALLALPFYEGDDLHPPENVEKMSRGDPLTDEDRQPWLERIAQLIGEQLAKEQPAVVASSALKRSYRERLRQGRENVLFVHLEGDFDLIRRRMDAREDHFFMGPEMLRSQFEALERPAASEAIAITVSAAVDVEAIVDEIVQRLASKEA